jgi:hypothetical protein
MTDLTKARQYADPWGGVEQEIAPERVRQWGRDIVERPISIGLPGMYFTAGQDPEGRRRLLQTEEAPEGARTFDPAMGLITEAQAIKGGASWAMGKANVRMAKGWMKKAVNAMRKADTEDVTGNVKVFPKEVWQRIRKIYSGGRHPQHGNISGALEHHPGLSKELDEWSIWLNTRVADPSTMTHEGAHVASQLFGEWAEQSGKSGAFSKLRRLWGRMKHDAQTLEGTLQLRGNQDLAERVYKLNPDEVFARRFAEAVDEGLEFVDATKFAVHEVRANMKFSREAMEEAVEWLNTQGVGMTNPYYFGGFEK